MNKIEIITVPVVVLGIVNAFLVKCGKNAILVDAGLPKRSSRFKRAIKNAGLELGDISLIVITHAHIDHAGGAASLKRLTGAKILGHEGDLKYYERKEEMTFCRTGNYGTLLLKSGFIKAPYEAFTPDILLKESEEFDLTPYGIPGKVVPTPGHTCGSLSVILSDGTAVVGDMLSSGILGATRPPFEDNPKLVSEELIKMVKNGSSFFYVGHGRPLKDNDVLGHAKMLAKL